MDHSMASNKDIQDFTRADKFYYKSWYQLSKCYISTDFSINSKLMLFSLSKTTSISTLDGKKSEAWTGTRWYMDVWKTEWMTEWKNVDIHEPLWLRCWTWCFLWAVLDAVYLAIDPHQMSR